MPTEFETAITNKRPFAEPTDTETSPHHSASCCGEVRGEELHGRFAELIRTNPFAVELVVVTRDSKPPAIQSMTFLVDATCRVG
jgi:hypothetical protein